MNKKKTEIKKKISGGCGSRGNCAGASTWCLRPTRETELRSSSGQLLCNAPPSLARTLSYRKHARLRKISTLATRSG